MTQLHVIVALLMVTIPQAFSACSYIQFGADHTMCSYTKKACPKAGGCLARGVTATDKTAIVKTHNDFRSKVANGLQPPQPKASNMREMKWDDELGTIAQRWADQCKFGHDANRRVTAYQVGQSVAVTMSSAAGAKADFPGVIKMWYDEVTSFDKSQINPFTFTSETGHYSAIAWALSDRIGCGYVQYYEDKWYKNLYVCNYGPGGNVITTVMYEQGEPATTCKDGKSTAYPGLCAS